MQKVIDWGRIEVSMRQRFRREPLVRKRIPSIVEILKSVVKHAGDQTLTRRSLRNIGISLLASKGELNIVSPICLYLPPCGNYSPAPSELVQKHIAFLESFGSDIPPWKVTFVFPPPEKEDEKAEHYIRAVCELTKARYAACSSIEVTMMTDYAPGMIAMEESVIEEIQGSPHLLKLSKRVGGQRSEYYGSINIPPELWNRRTRRTMAQYIILGRLALLQGKVLCNHTSANIRCALYGGGGVLHNPVGFR